jgi:hypothetical protein
VSSATAVSVGLTAVSGCVFSGSDSDASGRAWLLLLFCPPLQAAKPNISNIMPSKSVTRFIICFNLLVKMGIPCFLMDSDIFYAIEIKTSILRMA